MVSLISEMSSDRESINIQVSPTSMMRWRMDFSEIISSIIATSLPDNLVLSLRDSILHPVKAHIHGFRFTRLYQVVCDTTRTFIVGNDRCSTLGMSHSNKFVAKICTLLAIQEQRTIFGFSRRGHYDI
jgi:hypothetical protein